MKDFFLHFWKSYCNSIKEMVLMPSPITFIIFILPFIGPFLYFMTFYDPNEVL